MIVRRAVPPGWSSTILIDDAPPGVTLLVYPDGDVRLEHPCKITRPNDGERQQLVCAPLLSEHSIDWAEIVPTISPSVLCPDCGLHGFIENGRWRAA